MQVSYILAREFGWTPRQVQKMTMAQAAIYIQMLEEEIKRRKHE